MARNTKMIHFFAGMACSAIASLFGIVAAALAPVMLGFAKEMYVHFSTKMPMPKISPGLLPVQQLLCFASGCCPSGSDADHP